MSTNPGTSSTTPPVTEIAFLLARYESMQEG